MSCGLDGWMEGDEMMMMEMEMKRVGDGEFAVDELQGLKVSVLTPDSTLLT